MPKKRIKVPMDGVSFTSDEETILLTKGVTTCIAFLVQDLFGMKRRRMKLTFAVFTIGQVLG